MFGEGQPLRELLLQDQSEDELPLQCRCIVTKRSCLPRDLPNHMLQQIAWWRNSFYSSSICFQKTFNQIDSITINFHVLTLWYSWALVNSQLDLTAAYKRGKCSDGIRILLLALVACTLQLGRPFSHHCLGYCQLASA